MSLLIACLLIHHMGLSWPWYALAVTVWIIRDLIRSFGGSNAQR